MLKTLHGTTDANNEESRAPFAHTVFTMRSCSGTHMPRNHKMWRKTFHFR